MHVQYDLTSIDPEQLLKRVRRDTGCNNVCLRSEMDLYSEYVQWLERGSKTTTVRYRRGAIDCPQRYQLSLYATKNHGTHGRRPAGQILLQKMIIKRFGELTTEDAIKDGFSSVTEFIQALQDIYGAIKPSEFVTIYTIKLVPAKQDEH